MEAVAVVIRTIVILTLATGSVFLELDKPGSSACFAQEYRLAEEALRVGEAEEEAAELAAHRRAKLIKDFGSSLEAFGHISEHRWATMIGEQRKAYVEILEQCEKLGIITVNWGARKGQSMPTYQYVPGYTPGDPVPTGPGGIITGVEGGTSAFAPPVSIRATPLAFAGITKVINLRLRAERRALTKNLSAAVDEIDNQFVKPLKKYPFFESVQMSGDPKWETYVEDMQGYRLGKLSTYQPVQGEKTHNVEWIIFDVHILVDPTKSGLAAATASTAATS